VYNCKNLVFSHFGLVFVVASSGMGCVYRVHIPTFNPLNQEIMLWTNLVIYSGCMNSNK